MRRLFRAIILLLVGFMGAGFGIHRLGDSQPVSVGMLFADEFGHSCDSPCLLGVRPGEMRYDAAVALLQRHPVTRGLEYKAINYRMTLFNGRGLTVFILKTPGGNVASIGLQFFPSKFFPSNSGMDQSLPTPPVQAATYGDVITALGAPSAVYSATTQDAVWSYFFVDRLIVGTSVPGGAHLHTDDAVDFMSLVANRHLQTPGTLAQWAGFRSLQHYATLGEGINPIDPQ